MSDHENMLSAIKVLKELDKEPTIETLCIASQEGELNIVKLCIEAGVGLNLFYEKKWLPLHLACGDGQLEIVKLLIEHGADINKLNKDDEGKGVTPITTAIFDNHIDVVKLLIESGADINKSDDFNRKIIEYAYKYKRQEIINPAKRNMLFPAKRNMLFRLNNC